MADWREYYRAHTVSAHEAVGLIRSGDRVVVITENQGMNDLSDIIR